MSWQLALVFVIEGLAVAYLVYMLVPRKVRPKVTERPDVKVSDLTKKR